MKLSKVPVEQRAGRIVAPRQRHLKLAIRFVTFEKIVAIVLLMMFIIEWYLDLVCSGVKLMILLMFQKCCKSLRHMQMADFPSGKPKVEIWQAGVSSNTPYSTYYIATGV